jgi:hypothetical protein
MSQLIALIAVAMSSRRHPCCLTGAQVMRSSVVYLLWRRVAAMCLSARIQGGRALVDVSKHTSLLAGLRRVTFSLAVRFWRWKGTLSIPAGCCPALVFCLSVHLIRVLGTPVCAARVPWLVLCLAYVRARCVVAQAVFLCMAWFVLPCICAQAGRAVARATAALHWRAAVYHKRCC